MSRVSARAARLLLALGLLGGLAAPGQAQEPAPIYDEAALPVDQHQLLALIAPRPLLVSPKSEDRWADPRGMVLSARHASPAWRLLGHEGLAAGTMPAPGTPVLSRVGAFLRPGEHDLLPADWAVFLDFADRHLRPSAAR
jgi:hypothetical protein